MVIDNRQARTRRLYHADSDEAGQVFQEEAGHLFRFEAGQGSDLMSATWGIGHAGRE
jgi:hypothetical protein